MSDTSVFDQPLVFGLDIGTRNVVGTVGYKTENEFVVVAQYMLEHETRAMLDGQIHDIGRVGHTIAKVKEELESQIGQELTEVCIAAAGRVLKTVTTNISYDFPEETVVTGEDIHTLDLLGIEKAQSILKEMNDTRYKFYCVGYSVMKYFLNDEPFSSLESHKAERISEDIIVTFLPEDVVDGLYAAVGMAGLTVANMTLEPIAAINVAIPENYRLLNIALVDIGAGTTDVAVISVGGVVVSASVKVAGDNFNHAIMNYVREKHSLFIGEDAAENIKIKIGTASEEADLRTMEVKGRNIITGLPKVATLTSEEIRTALRETTGQIVEAVHGVLEKTPPELAADIMDRGIVLTGGGAMLHGMDTLIEQKTGVSTLTVQDAMLVVAAGTGKYAEIMSRV